MRAKIKRTPGKSHRANIASPPVNKDGASSCAVDEPGIDERDEARQSVTFDKLILLGINFSGLKGIASNVSFPCTYNLENTFSPWILRQRLKYSEGYIQVYRDIYDKDNLIPRIVEETLHNTIEFEQGCPGYCQVDFVLNGVQYSCRVEQQYFGDNEQGSNVARVYSYVKDTPTGEMQDTVCEIPKGKLLQRNAYAQELSSNNDSGIGMQLRESVFLDAFFRECLITSVEVFNRRLFIE